MQITSVTATENLCTVRPFEDMLALGAVTYAQPSVTKVGGVSEFPRMAGLCELYGGELAPHSPYFGPGFVATLRLIAHTGRARWIERIYVELEAELFTQPLSFENGAYTVPEAPGLGIEINREIFDAYRLDPA